jgi:hypothetical protein
MSPRTRAQAYEELKDLRRRGKLQQAKGVKAVLETLAKVGYKAKPGRKIVRGRPVKAPSLEQELFRVLEIQALADRVFGDEKKANIWLHRPNSSMSGQIPLDLMKDELGAAVVREALEQIDHGIFA